MDFELIYITDLNVNTLTIFFAGRDIDRTYLSRVFKDLGMQVEPEQFYFDEVEAEWTCLDKNYELDVLYTEPGEVVLDKVKLSEFYL